MFIYRGSGIENWCEEHLGQVLPITYSKDYGMIALYDDRRVQVETNTGRLIEDGCFNTEDLVGYVNVLADKVEDDAGRRPNILLVGGLEIRLL